MGNKHDKLKLKKNDIIPQETEDSTLNIPAPVPIPELNDVDLEFLSQQTGSSKAVIQNTFEIFIKDNPDGKLSITEFIRIYNELRPEPPEFLDEISKYVFKAFDSDNNGTISFSEFMLAYAITSRGDLKTKLEYAFILYDGDGSGYLDYNELKNVLSGMLDLIGADETTQAATIAEQCLGELDISKDGRITKDEFVSGLLRSYSLRSLMSPFN